ncbi:malate dehydrogenase [Portunus trituberculatus]|uniref:Malate dehydrogenase n=1 Tax=Portunus trituberculatus TaxID=210409 RepID=A0A5B7IC55_PORTR|nr:malate dehydrogenase [Portunus trituberculatus]
MVAADVRGHYSHGLQRIGKMLNFKNPREVQHTINVKLLICVVDLYVTELRHGVTDGRVTPSIVCESASSALVDGNNGFGSVVGNFCMDLAIEKARKTGIACVCAKVDLEGWKRFAPVALDLHFHILLACGGSHAKGSKYPTRKMNYPRKSGFSTELQYSPAPALNSES